MIIEDFKTLQRYAKAAAQNKIGLLVVVGRGGIGKSHTIKEVLKDAPHLVLSSHLTPAACYEALYNHRDETVFINDIDKVFSNPVLLSLLKQATETTSEKKIQYNSKTPLMADLPREFKTNSSLIIDANELPPKNKNAKALLTRGVLIEFQPPVKELLRTLKKFAQDAKVLSFLTRLVNAGGVLDLRKYVVAEQLKSARLDWREYLGQELQLPPDALVLLRALRTHKTYKERVDYWVQATGKSARSFDRLKKKLEAKR